MVFFVLEVADDGLLHKLVINIDAVLMAKNGCSRYIYCLSSYEKYSKLTANCIRHSLCCRDQVAYKSLINIQHAFILTQVAGVVAFV